MKTVNTRTTEHPINDIFLKRYSPRAFSGEGLSKDEILTIFEAARWAPSSRNFQSWRFVYCTRESQEFPTFLSFLTESNQVWCKHAGMLVVVLSKSIRHDGTHQKNHEFEAGLATENLLLQATEMKLVVHPMGGILPEIVKEKLKLTSEYTPHIMIAIGRPGKIEDLPEKLQAREAPSQRKPLEEIVFEEKFPNN
jgi:nitroreductase